MCTLPLNHRWRVIAGTAQDKPKNEQWMNKLMLSFQCWFILFIYFKRNSFGKSNVSLVSSIVRGWACYDTDITEKKVKVAKNCKSYKYLDIFKSYAYYIREKNVKVAKIYVNLINILNVSKTYKCVRIAKFIWYLNIDFLWFLSQKRTGFLRFKIKMK